VNPGKNETVVIDIYNKTNEYTEEFTVFYDNDRQKIILPAVKADSRAVFVIDHTNSETLKSKLYIEYNGKKEIAIYELYKEAGGRVEIDIVYVTNNQKETLYNDVSGNFLNVNNLRYNQKYHAVYYYENNVLKEIAEN
jgi:hypothetical protein